MNSIYSIAKTKTVDKKSKSFDIIDNFCRKSRLFVETFGFFVEKIRMSHIQLFVCELGQRLSDAFEKIKFTIDQFDWYLLPIQVK